MGERDEPARARPVPFCFQGLAPPPRTPARVFKGTRMAGRLGAEKVTTLNLAVVATDPEKNLLLVRGAVPGPKGGIVVVRDAVKATAKGGA